MQGASRFIIGKLLPRSENQEKSLYYAAPSCLFSSLIFLFSIHFTSNLQAAPIVPAVNPLGPQHLLLLRHGAPCQSAEPIYLEKSLCAFLGVEQRL